MISDRFLAIITGIVMVVLVFSGRANAQNTGRELGDGRSLGGTSFQTGRGLDASLRVGSGGINSPLLTNNYDSPQNAVTGNVTGDSYFRGNIDYRAPGEFGGETSSSDLFRFRARTVDLRRLDSTRVNPYSMPKGFFSSFSNVDSGYLREGASHRPTALTNTGLFRAYNAGRGARIPAWNTSIRSTEGHQLTYLQDGRILEISTSPLLGIRTTVRDPSKRLGLRQPLPGDETGPDVEADVPDLQETDGARQDPQSYRINPHEIGNVPDAAVAIAKPSIDPGIKLDHRLRNERHPSRESALAKGVSQIETHLFRPLDGHPMTTVDDVYRDRLTNIRQNYLAAGGNVATHLIDPTPLDAVTRQPAAPDGAGTERTTDSVAQPRINLDIPTLDQMRKAAHARRRAVQAGDDSNQSTLNKIGIAVDPNKKLETLRKKADLLGILQVTASSARAREDGEDPQDEQGADVDNGKDDRSTLDRFLDALDYELPDLKTLAGEQRTRINTLLSEAEQQLADGQYFEAEKSYRMVLIRVPRHPMARVGVIHSQLGAGMIRSAAYNLRTFFEQHPEMIATRYAPSLLPRPDRQKWARREVEKMVHASKRSDAAVLLAYLGHLSRQNELVVYGLDLAQARNPLDPLLVVLRRIWLDEKPDSSANPQTSSERHDGDASENGNAGDRHAPENE